jgi:cytochrome c
MHESSFKMAKTRHGGALLALFTVVCAIPFATGCATANEPELARPTGVVPRPPVGPTPAELQARRGAKYWTSDCGPCHGANGEGAEGGPRIIGVGALPADPPSTANMRAQRFVHATEVFQFTRRHMPADFAALATDDYYWDVVAFVLSKNGIDLKGHVLDADSAEQVLVHPK